MINRVYRGEIYIVKLADGSIRPVVIIQNNIGNKYRPTTIVAQMTGRTFESDLPTRVEIKKSEINNLNKDSTILLEKIDTVDKKYFIKKVGKVEDIIMDKVDQAIITSTALNRASFEKRLKTLEKVIKMAEDCNVENKEFFEELENYKKDLTQLMNDDSLK